MRPARLLTATPPSLGNYACEALPRMISYRNISYRLETTCVTHSRAHDYLPGNITWELRCDSLPARYPSEMERVPVTRHWESPSLTNKLTEHLHWGQYLPDSRIQNQIDINPQAVIKSLVLATYRDII